MTSADSKGIGVPADSDSLQAWVGRVESTEDCLAPERVQALHLALGRSEPLPEPGDALPPLRHWLYFWPLAARSELGPDGAPAPGGLLPPLGRARRMWAGSRVSFVRRLSIGESVTKRSTIAAVTPKEGRSGPLVFVTIRHEIGSADGVALIDEQDLVFRQDGGAVARPGVPARTDAELGERIEVDPVLLFRYSALTYNGHRIHYDRRYVTEVEGYPGLLVHGPLLATLMADVAQRARPQRAMARFEFRALRPVIDSEPFTVCASSRSDASVELWIADAAGFTATTGSAEFR